MSDGSGPSGTETSIDLAREPDFSLGASRVSPSTREVFRGSEREVLEPRVMQVLVALAQAQGRVVSRDELIARCWEGRIVGEDAINRAIGRLRRLSEVDRDASFTIETIARVGYRLISADIPGVAPDETLQSAPPGDIKAAVPLPGSPLHRHRRIVAAAVLLVIGSAAAWLFWPAPHWTVEGSRPFISTLALEDNPAFSPNGAMLAYTSASDDGPRQVYVRNLAGGEGARITNDASDDTTPSWSSDGAHIAYIAIRKGQPCSIMVVTVPGGETREAGRCRKAVNSALTWQPGGPFVYFVERAGLGGDTIFRLNLDTGTREPIVQEPALRDIVASPSVSPDGKWLAYLLRSQHIVLHDLASGREKILGDISRRGDWDTALAWSADSRAVLAGISGDVGGSLIMAYPLNGDAPYQVYVSASRTGRLAVGGTMLALETDTTRTALARAANAPSAQPDMLDQASGYTWSPTFAPDGTLAYLSNRSGGNAIWVMKPGAAPTMLLDDGLTALYRVRFSPDGTKLAVASETPETVTIRIMTAAGATLTSFDMPSLGLGLPSWTLDGKAVILFDRRCLCTYRISADNPTQRNKFAAPHWVGIAIRSEGTFATRADPDGIWRIDGGTRQISASYPHFYLSPMAFRGTDVLVPDYSATPVRLFAQPLAGGPAQPIAYAPGAQNQPWLQSDFAVNPKTGEIVYVAAAAHDTNIDLLTLAKR